MIHTILAINPQAGSFKVTHIDFETDAPLREAVFALIQNNPQYHDSFIMDATTLCPITFDCTVTLMGATRSYHSDQWACTFSDFQKHMSNVESKECFVSHSAPFCRFLRSRSGKAGEFFTDHANEEFNKFRDSAKPFEEGVIFNSPEHYWRNLNAAG